MANLKFLFGENLSSSIPFVAGTIYLDTATGEMWFDDPNKATTSHRKIIDSNTLIYKIDSTVEFGGGVTTTARLGSAILGTMVLGNE